MNEEGLALLRSIEALMKDFTLEMRRQNDATDELARRRKAGADRESKRRAKLRQRDAIPAKPMESHDPPLRQNDATLQVVAVALAVQDQDQKQRTKILQPDATLTPQPAAEPVTRPVWLAYSTAYRLKYGCLPVRNRKVNGQLAQVVQRLGVQEAPEVAAFYVGHKDAFYARDRHGVGLLLRDCEKLRTDWARGEQITSTEARSEEKTAANFGGWSRHLKGAKDALG